MKRGWGIRPKNKKPSLNQRRVYLEVVCRVRTILHAYVRFCSGGGTPARKHDHPYTPYQTPPTITCSAICPSFKSATYMASISIGRVCVTSRSGDGR